MKAHSLRLPFSITEVKANLAKKSAKKKSNSSLESHHINPRYRAYGKARIDIARRVQSQDDWDELWKDSLHPFSFSFPWGESWKHCIEYRVDDFAAEIGFWIDIIGLSVNALGPEYAQFTSPGGELCFAVAQTPPGEAATPPGTIRIQFMIQRLEETVEEMTNRSIVFINLPQVVDPGANLMVATFQTPHGICVDLWGESIIRFEPAEYQPASKLPDIDEIPPLFDWNENKDNNVLEDLQKISPPEVTFTGSETFDEWKEPLESLSEKDDLVNDKNLPEEPFQEDITYEPIEEDPEDDADENKNSLPAIRARYLNQ